MYRLLAGFGMAVVLAARWTPQAAKPPAGVALADLSWVEAEPVLTQSAVVVIPLGIATVEHGPHLKLNNNERLATYLASRVQTAAQVVVAPPITYHFSPTFVEYPGSVSLSQRTATDMTVQIVRSLARYGPRRFYALNTNGTTLGPLRAAVDALANDGILLGYTDMNTVPAARIPRQQMDLRMAHADEIETSIMLYVDPSAVDMRKAVAEYGTGSGPLTRQKSAPGVYSATGILGDPTLATREKGAVLVETLVTNILSDIESVRREALPQAKAAPTAAPSAAAPRTTRAEPQQPNGCTPGDERSIRLLGPLFSSYWRQMDVVKLAGLFTDTADIRHPDGVIERGPAVIRQNRAELFSRPAYRGSVHAVSLNDIRCMGPSHAIADGKWELRLMDESLVGREGAAPQRLYKGWCTLVLTGGNGQWSIEAWRYTIDPPSGTPAPTTLKQPGFLGRQDH